MSDEVNSCVGSALVPFALASAASISDELNS
jgi:hypothetical protein